MASLADRSKAGRIVLTMLATLGFIIVLGFISAGIANIRHNVQKNRRLNREYKDQKQWERFSNREAK